MISRIAWMTDIHLDFVSDERIGKLCESVISKGPEVVLVGGDIATSENLSLSLCTIVAHLKLPTYFVLGNHDYYGSSIKKVREEIKTLTSKSTYLHWLPAEAPVSLSDDTCLVGHGCWADGRLGDYHGSMVLLNDFSQIAELRGLNKDDRLTKLNELGDESAEALGLQLKEVAKVGFKTVIVLTHAVPFMEGAWHEGRICDKDWLPHMSCKAAGEVLKAHAEAHKEQRMIVLSGHTHGAGTCQILPNLQVRTGGAEYYRPEVQELIVASASGDYGGC